MIASYYDVNLDYVYNKMYLLSVSADEKCTTCRTNKADNIFIRIHWVPNWTTIK